MVTAPLLSPINTSHAAEVAVEAVWGFDETEGGAAEMHSNETKNEEESHT